MCSQMEKTVLEGAWLMGSAGPRLGRVGGGRKQGT